MANLSRLPAPIIESYEWQEQGACADVSVERFFSPDLERGAPRRAREQAAKAICAPCPVKDRCLAHALSVREPYGIWGGATTEERAVMLSMRRDREAAA